MSEKRQRKRIIVSCLICIVLIGVYFRHSRKPAFEIHFLDVGQGDAIFIQYKTFQLLIDGGPDNMVLEQLRQVMPIGDNHLDWVVLSHPDADHITGLIDILSSYSVGRILMPAKEKQTNLYAAWLKQIEEKAIPITYIEAAFDYAIDETVLISFLHPTPKTMKGIDGANNASIVMHIQFDEIDVFLPGDIEEEVETMLVNEYVQRDVEMLKVPHHGSKSSSTKPFLDMLDPEIVVIQSGKENRFGHPHLRVLHRYAAIDADIFRTDEEGTISFGSNGQELWRLHQWFPFFPQVVGFKKESLYNEGS